MSLPQRKPVDVPDRCLASFRDMFRESGQPMRHLHIVEARPEWREWPGPPSICYAPARVVVMEGFDGYARYALAYDRGVAGSKES